MRIVILAFAGGILFLQVQGELPAPGLIAGLAALGLCGLLLCWPRRRLRALALVCCALLGFSWAAGLAQQRLADQLQSVWEGRDIELTGVVAALPQRFARGERFEFDVESAQAASSDAAQGAAIVPRRILLRGQEVLHGLRDGEFDIHEPAIKLPLTNSDEKSKVVVRIAKSILHIPHTWVLLGRYVHIDID